MEQHALSFILLMLMLLAGASVRAQVMESTNYQIQSDSINFGGSFSSSTTYRLEDTAGEIATGPSVSASYQLRAGYQQMQEVYLALTAANDVTMTPTLGGITGGIANGSTTATATTDSLAGYQLTIRASSSPAMNHEGGSGSISDFAPGATPAFTFSVGSGQTAFAYSPEGSDIVSRFKDNGSVCDTGSSDTAGACFDGLSTSDVAIARRESSNHPNGTPTTITFKVGIGSGNNVAEGTYTATTTLTLTAL